MGLKKRKDNGGIPARELKDELRGGLGSRPGSAAIELPIPGTAAETSGAVKSSAVSIGNAAAAMLNKVQHIEKAQLEKRSGTIAWTMLGAVVFSLLAAYATGLLPNFVLVGAFAALLAVVPYVLNLFQSIAKAATRSSAVFSVTAIFAAGGALFGAIGTIAWAYAVSGIVLLAFTMIVWRVHGDSTTVKVTVKGEADDIDDDDIVGD